MQVAVLSLWPNAFWLILKRWFSECTVRFFVFLKCTIQSGPKVDVLLIAFLYLWRKFWEGIDKYWIVPVRKLFYCHHWMWSIPLDQFHVTERLYSGPALNRCSCIGPRASGRHTPWCLRRLFVFLQVLLELENSIERLINLAVSKQLSHLNQRWIFYTKHYQKYSIFMLYKALYLRSSISHSMNGAWLLLTY